MNSSVQSLKNRAAGDNAMSSADPYLMLRIVGEEERVFYDGKEKFQKETLNPDFFEAQELFPVRMQDDWLLEVQVMD